MPTVQNIATVHFNTQQLTMATVASIRKHTPGCRITVFDNSDRLPFPKYPGVTVIDNTKGQCIDFGELLARYPDQKSTDYYQASAKHIASVDYLFDVLTEGFVLLDSDALVKKDIAALFDPDCAWVGTIERPAEQYKAVRLAPYLLWLNVPVLRRNGIRFWHEGMAYKLSHNGPPYHDTGGSLFYDCTDARLPARIIDIYEYIEHLGEGSFRRTETETRRWLDRNADLWNRNLI